MIIFFFFFFPPKKNEKEKDLNILFLRETEIERFKYLVKLMLSMDNILVVYLRELCYERELQRHYVACSLYMGLIVAITY